MELDDLRKEIDDIDKEMKSLFLKRMEIVKQIALIKKAKSLPVFQKSREEEMINSLSSSINEDILPFYRLFLLNILELSKNYQIKLLGGVKHE